MCLLNYQTTKDNNPAYLRRRHMVLTASSGIYFLAFKEKIRIYFAYFPQQEIISKHRI